MVRFPCGSMSQHSTRWPSSANATARLSVVVVLATPPFWLASAITLGRAGTGSVAISFDLRLGRELIRACIRRRAGKSFAHPGFQLHGRPRRLVLVGLGKHDLLREGALLAQLWRDAWQLSLDLALDIT